MPPRHFERGRQLVSAQGGERCHRPALSAPAAGDGSEGFGREQNLELLFVGGELEVGALAVGGEGSVGAADLEGGAVEMRRRYRAFQRHRDGRELGTACHLSVTQK